MNQSPEEIGKRYAHALREYLDGAGEEALRGAYELGREAVEQGFGLLEAVAVGFEASRCVLIETILSQGDLNEQAQQQIARVGDFLIESLSAFEMTHRSSADANSALRRLNEILEEEIKRIAYSLHDDAGQLLASVHIALAQWAKSLPESNREPIDHIRGLLGQIEAQLRHLSHELRPSILDDLGLRPALEFLAEGLNQRSGLRIHVGGGTDGRLPPAVEITLYRIVQEALTNIIKHAGATDAEVWLNRKDASLHCAISDNGRGFDAEAVLAGEAKRGLGLLGIQERLEAVGGSLKIVSDNVGGTTLSVSIPLEERYEYKSTLGR